MIKILMHGCNGKMGRMITEIAKQDQDVEIVAGVDKYTAVANEYPVFETISECDVDADAVIDFSNAGAVDELLDYCVEKSQHKIKFYFGPSAFKGLSGTVQDDFFCQTFIDHITHSLRTGFRGKSKTAFPDVLYAAHNVQRKCIDPQGWQRNINPLLLKFIDQEKNQFFQFGIVAGT